MFYITSLFIDAQAIVFGCPAVLDIEQSTGTKDYITSVVSDADIITRMSGPSIANMFLDIMSHDWTDMALVDLELLTDHVRKTLPLDKEKVLKWANDTLQTKYKPHFSKITKERIDQVLYPPGTCIHLWRNGIGHSGMMYFAFYLPLYYVFLLSSLGSKNLPFGAPNKATYTSCSFFNEGMCKAFEHCAAKVISFHGLSSNIPPRFCVCNCVTLIPTIYSRILKNFD